jgi:hypothetical protein
MMERVALAGRGERKMGLRWRLICEGRLVWLVLAESKGGADGLWGTERGEGRWVLVSGWGREDEKEKGPEGKGE